MDKSVANSFQWIIRYLTTVKGLAEFCKLNQKFTKGSLTNQEKALIGKYVPDFIKNPSTESINSLRMRVTA